MTRKLTISMTAVVLAVVLAVGAYTRLPAQITNAAGGTSAASTTPTQVLTGTYRVNLDTGTGTRTLNQITRIEFHDQYLIVTDFRGSGQVIPIGQIKQLTWDSI